MTAADASHECATRAVLQILSAGFRVEMHQIETRLTGWTAGTMLGGMTAAATAAVTALAN